MSWQAVEWAFRQAGSRNSRKRSSRKLVLVCLAHHFNPKEGVSRPGRDCIERETNLDHKTVNEAIAELESLRLVARQKKRGRHGENRYALSIPPDFDPRQKSKFPPSINADKSGNLVDESRNFPLDESGNVPHKQQSEQQLQNHNHSLANASEEVAYVPRDPTGSTKNGTPVAKSNGRKRAGKGGSCDGSTKMFLGWWCVQYQEKTGLKYRTQGKDAKAASELLKCKRVAEVQEMANFLLEIEESWYATNKTLTILNGRWNELGQLRNKHERSLKPSLPEWREGSTRLAKRDCLATAK